MARPEWVVLVDIDGRLSNYWNIYWILIPPLTIGKICGFFLHLLTRGAVGAWRMEHAATGEHALVVGPFLEFCDCCDCF